ncbi:MAG: hypothetical protein NC337_05155 [Roseburia sp.]|nr:hypothetical protein [Roseburia sp.]
MRKLLVLCFCFALCLPVTACGGSSKEAEEMAAAAAALGDKLDSGKFMVDGNEYVFPSEMSDWTDNGWHISNNYNNKDSFELEPMIETTTFELFQDEGGNYVQMKAYNDTDENVKVEGGMVSYVRLKFSSSKDDLSVILPGGVNYKSTLDDVVGIYGEPAERDDDSLIYTYDTGKWICNVCFEFGGSDNEIEHAEYYLSDDNWGSIRTAEDCEQFVDDALRTSFYGDYARYVENKFDTEEGAAALYANEIQYYANSLMYYLDVNYEVIDEEILEGYYDLAGQLFMKFKWDTPVFSTNDMSKFAIGDALVGDLTLTLYPTDFLDIILDNAQVVVDEFQANHEGIDPDSLSDEEYLNLENEYAANMLAAITPKVDEISYREPVVMVYEVDTYEGAVLSDNDWSEIDDILMDFME